MIRAGLNRLVRLQIELLFGSCQSSWRIRSLCQKCHSVLFYLSLYRTMHMAHFSLYLAAPMLHYPKRRSTYAGRLANGLRRSHLQVSPRDPPCDLDTPPPSLLGGSVREDGGLRNVKSARLGQKGSLRNRVWMTSSTCLPARRLSWSPTCAGLGRTPQAVNPTAWTRFKPILAPFSCVIFLSRVQL